MSVKMLILRDTKQVWIISLLEDTREFEIAEIKPRSRPGNNAVQSPLATLR